MDLETIINATFKNEIQVKRIRKELQQIYSLPKEEFKVSLKQGVQSLHILVTLPAINQLNSARPIQFLIYLDSRFPFVFPRVHLLSHVTKPTLADGRDYIEDIIHQPWSPSVLLFEIIQILPKFLENVRMNQQNRDFLLQLGKFHLDAEYDPNLGYEDVEFFQCKDIVNGHTYQRVLQLSNSYFLILEYQNKQLILLVVTPTKDLISFDKIDNRAVLIWKQNDEAQHTQTIQTTNLDQFLDSVKAYKMGSSGKKISQQDVTLQKFQEMNIEELLNSIQNQETMLNDNLNKEQLDMMMNLYQQAIEYYSAYSDSEYQQYVIKLQTLLGREDIQQILAKG